MEPIKDTIKEVMRGLRNKKQKHLPQDNIRKLLQRTLNKKEREHAGFAYFSKGILSLSVDSSVWLYQLSLQKEQLLNKLRKKTKTIKDVKFFIGDGSEKEQKN